MYRVIRIIWIVSIGLLISQAIYYFPQLPDNLASHFDSSGNPDGHSSKSGFYVLWAFTIISINVWMLLLGFILRKVPSEFISIPNKEFWLANDKRRKKLTEIMISSIGLILIGTNILLVEIFQHTAESNLYNLKELGLVEVMLPFAIISVIAILYLLFKLTRPSSIK